MQSLVFNILAICALISTPSFAHLLYNQDCDDSPEAALDLTPTLKSDLADESFLNPELNSGPSGIMGRSGETGPREDELTCYADDPDFQRLRASHPNAPETDRKVAINFCRQAGYQNPVDCADDVIERGLVGEAKGCLDSVAAIGNSLAVTPKAHQLQSSAAGTPGTYHLDYKYNKEGGWHRYDWTAVSRDHAGRNYASKMLRQARADREVISRTETNKSNASGNAGVNGQLSTGNGLAGFGLGANAGISGGSEKEVSVEKGPLLQSEIDKLLKKYYEMGYAKPMLGDTHPDIICFRNEPTCSSDSVSGLIKNKDYKADPVKKDDKNSSSNDDKPSREKSNDSSRPATAESQKNSGSNPIETKDHGLWAGEPTPMKPGEVWVDYAPNVGENDPMAACLFKSYKAKVKDTSNKNYQPGALKKSDAELKREANILLAKGFCQVEYFGASYCTNWKKKFQLIDSAADSTPNRILPPRTEALPGAPHYKQPEHAAKIDFSKDLPRPSLPKEPAGLLKIP